MKNICVTEVGVIGDQRFDSILSSANYLGEGNSGELQSLNLLRQKIKYRRKSAREQMMKLVDKHTKSLSCTREEIQVAIRKWNATKPQDRVRYEYVLQAPLRQSRTQFAEDHILYSQYLAAEQKLRESISSEDCYHIIDSSDPFGRLVYEVARSVGAKCLFYDPLVEKERLFTSSEPLWLPFSVHDHGDTLPDLEYCEEFLKEEGVYSYERNFFQEISKEFQSHDQLSDVDQLDYALEPTISRSDLDALRHEGVREYTETQLADFVIIGERSAESRHLCADSSTYSTVDLAIQVAFQYPGESVVYRPAESIPVHYVERFAITPNLSICDWNDDELHDRAKEVLCRNSVNGLRLERMGRRVFWLSKSIYAGFCQHEPIHQKRLNSFLKSKTVPMKSLIQRS